MIADVLPTQRETVQPLRALNLAFVLTVKGNQPTLLQHLRAALPWPAPAPDAWDLGPGRIECRRIQVAPVGAADLARFRFPGVQTVKLVEFEAEEGGQQRLVTAGSAHARQVLRALHLKRHPPPGSSAPKTPAEKATVVTN